MNEGNLLAIGREAEALDTAFNICYLLLITAIGTHREELHASRLVTHKGNACTALNPLGRILVALGCSYLCACCTVHINGVQFATAVIILHARLREGIYYGLTIRREGSITESSH